MKRKKRKAFTLVELLVVVAIIGILASILIINVGGKTDKARVAAARAEIAQIETAVIEFKQDSLRLPERLEDLVNRPSYAKIFPDGGYLKRLPKDPWDNEYVYKMLSPTRFEIKSLGADGQPGGTDYSADISNME